MNNKKHYICGEVWYREFPCLLFEKAGSGLTYFDATHYISQKGDTQSHSVRDFESGFSFWIQAVCRVYEIPPGEIIIHDTESGRFMVEESLALLFAAYIEPDLAVYLLERISELFLSGIVLSDTVLLSMARERLTKEYLS